METLFALLAIHHRWIGLTNVQWCGALLFSFISAWTSCWINSQIVFDLRYPCDVTAMTFLSCEVCTGKISVWRFLWIFWKILVLLFQFQHWVFIEYFFLLITMGFRGCIEEYIISSTSTDFFLLLGDLWICWSINLSIHKKSHAKSSVWWN